MDVRGLLRKHAGRREIDCLVLCNGGRSSVLALYQATRRLKLRVLAVTLDHGFVRPEALDNVRRVVASLGVEHVVHRAMGMVPVFAAAVGGQQPVPVCALCNAWSRQVLTGIARKHGVSAVFLPAGPGALAAGAFHLAAPIQVGSLLRWRRDLDSFLRRHGPSFEDLDGVRVAPRVLDFPWKKKPHLGPLLLPSSAGDEELRALGWRPLAPSYPAGWDADCSLNLVAARRAIQDYGLTHYHLNLAHYVRIGAVPWQTMELALEVDLDDASLLDEQRRVLDALGCSRRDIGGT